MKVQYLDHMGDDLAVVNAARVSFAKVSHDFNEKDAKLIKYLAKHKHWSPFSHTCIKLHIEAPIFVARQLAKHQVGFAWNEVSRRYVDDAPVFYAPNEWRGKPVDKKQGSDGSVTLNQDDEMHLQGVYTYTQELYNNMIAKGIAPEQARMILPQSMMTQWIWTGNLYGFARVCQLRLACDTQQETREVAQQISDIIAPLFPVSWEVLNGN